MSIESTIENLLTEIRKRKMQFGFIASGGFSSLSKVFDTPGFSRILTHGTFLCGVESYHRFWPSHVDIPDKFVCPEMAESMWDESRIQEQNDIIHLAITGALPTDRSLKGGVRAHFRFNIGDKQHYGEITWNEIRGDSRICVSEEMVEKILGKVLLELTHAKPLPVKHISPDGKVREGIPKHRNAEVIAVYPGSWNPLHKAHKWVGKAITESKFCNWRLLYEVSTERIGKPDYTKEEVGIITDQFAWYNECIITNEALFENKRTTIMDDLGYDDKDKIWFVMGYDTFERWLEDYKPETHDKFNLILFPRVIGGILHSPQTLMQTSHKYRYYMHPEAPPEISSTDIRNLYNKV